MAIKNLLFILNPSAGRSQVKEQIFDIVEEFTNAGYRVTIFPTKHPLDGRRIVISEGSKYDLLVCAGGDGTLDDVVTGYMISGCQVPLGYIPAGSTNDFARSLGIPLDIKSAVTNVITGIPFSVDIGGFRDPEYPEPLHIPMDDDEDSPSKEYHMSPIVQRMENTELEKPRLAEDYFVYIAAFGAFTEVSYSTNQQIKNLFGHAAYILSAAANLGSNLTPYTATLEFDGERITDTFVYAMVTNSLSVGGMRNVVLSDDVLFDDGEFECLFIKMPTNPIELNTILNSLVISEVNEKYMYCFKCSKLTVTSETAIPWTLDGEFGGNHNQVCITNHQRSVKIIR